MPRQTSATSKGLLASLTALLATLVAIAQTRLELLSTDLEAERTHLFSLLVWMLISLSCLAVGLMLGALLLVVVFWDTHRLLVLSLLTGTFLLAGIAAWVFARYQVSCKPRLFASTLAEFHKDRRELAKP